MKFLKIVTLERSSCYNLFLTYISDLSVRLEEHSWWNILDITLPRAVLVVHGGWTQDEVPAYVCHVDTDTSQFAASILWPLLSGGYLQDEENLEIGFKIDIIAKVSTTCKYSSSLDPIYSIEKYFSKLLRFSFLP